MNPLEIHNHGPLITASNYWHSEYAQQGLLYLSVNGGALRLLVPQVQRRIISDMRQGAKHVVVSYLQRDKWPADGTPGYAVEWMVEAGSNSPWSCHLSPGQIDRAISNADVGREWIASVWDLKNGKPHKCLERPAYCLIVPSLPWLRRIDQ